MYTYLPNNNNNVSILVTYIRLVFFKYKRNNCYFNISAPFENEEDLVHENLKSFEAVMLLVPKPPGNRNWEPFLDNVRVRNSKEPINGLLPSVEGSGQVC